MVPVLVPICALAFVKVTVPKSANVVILLLTMGRSTIHSAVSNEEL